MAATNSASDLKLPDAPQGMRWKIEKYARTSNILLLQKRGLFGFWVTVSDEPLPYADDSDAAARRCVYRWLREDKNESIRGIYK